MRTVDHPALVVKHRSPLEADSRRGGVSAEWRRTALRDMARVPIPSVYRRAYERWRRIVEADSGPGGAVSSWTAACTGRLVIGTGGASILETGVALHHVYGVPFIPGSALKGLASHYAAQELGWRSSEESDAAKDLRADARRISFGTTAAMGLLAFWDAWLVPQASAALIGDILTVHHQQYYGEDRPEAEVWPVDWDDPIPFNLLSVKGEFLFAVESPVDAAALRVRDAVVESVLKPALRDWGIGAKTAAGYGRLA